MHARSRASTSVHQPAAQRCRDARKAAPPQPPLRYLRRWRRPQLKPGRLRHRRRVQSRPRPRQR
eukprot:3851252-Prymnesium_polylepis.2